METLAWSAEWDCMLFGTLEAAEAYYEEEMERQLHAEQLDHDLWLAETYGA